MGINEDLQDGIIGNPNIMKQIALGTGLGLRLDIDGLVIRLDLGIGIHAPYQTYKYTKEGTPDLTRPIKTYYNMPGLRIRSIQLRYQGIVAGTCHRGIMCAHGTSI